MEAVSFVREDRVPQMAGAAAVLTALDGRTGGADVSALVLNPRGLELALAAGVRSIHVAVMATDGMARANVNRSRDRPPRPWTSSSPARSRRGRPSPARSAWPSAAPSRATSTLAWSTTSWPMAAAGAAELMLADTIGIAVPRQVRRGVERAAAHGRPVGVHLHDTRNTAVANAVAALAAGATLFESAVGGAGGCPFAPGATGNLATEDLAWVLEREGVATGIDVEAVVAVAHWLEHQLERPLPGRSAAPAAR